MFAAVFSAPTFAAFLAASFILAVTPGPGVMYIVTRTLGLGRNAGLASLGGVALGNLANAALASVGLAAVFAASSTAFTVVKFLGAAYLVCLGLKALRTPSAVTDAGSLSRIAPRLLFRDGLLVALLNPKTALFFAALLPQFINPAISPLSQSLILGTVFVAIALCTDTMYVFTASALAGTLRLNSARPYGRYLAAASFIGLGIYAAVAGPRTPRG
jgi:threonine/homoserine/homoserine lactone efflux protein